MDLGGKAYRMRRIDFSPHPPTEGHRPLSPRKSGRTAPRPELARKVPGNWRAPTSWPPKRQRGGTLKRERAAPPGAAPSAIGSAAHYVSSRA